MESKADIREWNAIAGAYAREMEARGDRCFPDGIGERFWEVVGEVKGKAILDLGCGQGWLSGELARRGAAVVGIDGAETLVERARELYPGLAFRVGDLSEGIPGMAELGTMFDVVVSNMVVMDLPKVDTLFAAAGRVLRPGGMFVFTLPHPCFFMQKSYQDENGKWFKKLTGYLRPQTRRIESFGGHNHYHRPLSAYIRALAEAGLVVFEMYEPEHQARSDRVDPEFLRNFPVFLILGARKA